MYWLVTMRLNTVLCLYLNTVTYGYYLVLLFRFSWEVPAIQYLAKLESICKNSFGTYTWALSVAIRHMRTGCKKSHMQHHDPSCKHFFCDSLCHLTQTARKANLLHCSLLGKVFQDHDKGCAEGTDIGQDQANHGVSIWGQRGGVW